MDGSVMRCCLWLSPTDREAHKLLEIKSGYMVFDPGGMLPTPIRDSGENFRFGSFNHARKLSNASIDLFCDVMRACPNSRTCTQKHQFP